MPAVFDERASSYERFAAERAELQSLLSEKEYASARRSTINAHYTDAAYVRATWNAVEDLGFKGGAVLEPGCGSGNFFGFAPQGARLTGVEVDPVTARVAAALYPRAEVRSESFADTRAPDGSFDLVVGNVPFGRVVLHDPRHNTGGHSIHNHFLVKGLHLAKPGGLVAVLTSRYTLDSANPAARREMAELGDLVGAVRLPTGAHRHAAGTDVVTDLLVLRRREEGRAPAGESFERTRPLPGPGEDAGIRVNEYFIDHPDHVLGRMEVSQGEGGRPELAVVGEPAAGPALEKALAHIVARARERDLVWSPTTEPLASQPVARVGVGRPDGFLEAQPDGSFTRLQDGAAVPFEPPRTQTAELRALLQVRDAHIALLEAEAASVDDTAEIEDLRARLNDAYDAYVEAHGPLNRFSWRGTGRTDPETGEEKMARSTPRMGGFRADPYAPVVFALEDFDEANQTARKASIFTERVVAKKAQRLGADTPADALAICLDDYGEVRLAEIGRLLGVEEQDARRQLGTLVYDEPGTERLVPAAEYLSGNVREKLNVATTAASDDPRYGVNVSALQKVLPRELRPDEIDARMGAAWISEKYVQQYLREILEDDSIRVEHPGGSMWMVRTKHPGSVISTTRWGTGDYPAVEIAQALLEQTPIRVYHTDTDGRRVANPEATAAALEKAEEMSARFSEWVWEKPQRAAELSRIYNEQFNSLVPRSYDDAALSLPGLARSFQPRAHQVAAVARIINEPGVGLYHEVGAGKTAEMVMGAMELRRLGIAQKPLVVIPNHMLEQFAREWYQLYPQARVLAASRDDVSSAEKRRTFVGKVANGSWDGVVMTRSAFERIPMSVPAQETYLKREVEQIGAMLAKVESSDSRFSVKKLERQVLQAEERLKEKLDGVKDPGITFEQLGVDYIFVDEAHAYKNLRTSSRIEGMAVDGSQRAQDLHMKLEYLRERGPRVATLATATPIANSIGEVYTMQRYLRPDIMEKAGISDFDTWAATFGRTVTAIEVAPGSGELRMKTRFAKFRNVPELLQQWKVSGDIKTAEDLKLPVPKIAARADGQRLPEAVVVPASSELLGFVGELAERAERLRSRGRSAGDEDNFLKISSEGRAAALHLGLVQRATSEPQKITVAADRIAAIYERHRDAEYRNRDGSVQERRGALQLVFCDLGTPKAGEWSVYEELRQHLVARGVPELAVRFVHEARNDAEKAQLFQACRDGRVAVVIGSTEKMGVGTNIQDRMVALHHLDCPWRPADLAQREGRILRQGNRNSEVEILRYVTERSFDAYSWQTVARKATFIAQVMRGKVDVREIEDVGDGALSYNEVKALATGNPLLLKHAAAEAEVTRLERLERSHKRTQDTLRWTLGASETRNRELQEHVRACNEVLAHLGGEVPEFRMVIAGTTYDKPGVANDALRRAVVSGSAAWSDRGEQQIGSFHGFPIMFERDRAERTVRLELRGVPGASVKEGDAEIDKAAFATRLANRLEALPDQRRNAEAERERLQVNRERALEELQKPFGHAGALALARERLTTLTEEMERLARPPSPSPVVEPTAETWRGTLPEAVTEATRAAGGDPVVFVSASWRDQAKVRASGPHELLEALAQIPPGAREDATERPYGVRSDGTIHHVDAGLDVYLRVGPSDAQHDPEVREAAKRALAAFAAAAATDGAAKRRVEDREQPPASERERQAPDIDV